MHARLSRRALGAQLDALAERYVRELEANASGDLDKLAVALELATMAKLAAKPKQRRRGRALAPGRPREGGDPGRQAHESVADTLARLRAEGVPLDRAPEDHRARRPRGTKSRRVQAHRQSFDWRRD